MNLENSDRFSYQGAELKLFEHAINWKRYWSAQLMEYLGERVLEVGAGNGANTPFLNQRPDRQWVCLEPDAIMAGMLADRLRSRKLPATQVVNGTISSVPLSPAFDTIIYIDVLEHIENDAAEIDEAVKRLTRGGRLIVLGPAHQWLYSPFDRSLGHFRRYSMRALRALTTPELRLIAIKQLDSIGILASLANRLTLRQELPSLSQIHFWDRFIVPVSRLVDPLLFYSFGKSIVAVWERP
jgi:SAM-dependent methyltransferase